MARIIAGVSVVLGFAVVMLLWRRTPGSFPVLQVSEQWLADHRRDFVPKSR